MMHDNDNVYPHRILVCSDSNREEHKYLQLVANVNVKSQSLRGILGNFLLTIKNEPPMNPWKNVRMAASWKSPTAPSSNCNGRSMISRCSTRDEIPHSAL